MLFDGHRTCPVEYIKDVSLRFRQTEEFLDLLENLETLKSDNEFNLKQIQTYLEEDNTLNKKLVHGVKTFRRGINNHLDKIEADILTLANKMHSENSDLLANLKTGCHETDSEIEEHAQKLSCEHYTDHALFIHSVIIKRKLQLVDDAVKRTKSISKLDQCEFKPNQQLREIIGICTNLGTFEKVPQTDISICTGEPFNTQRRTTFEESTVKTVRKQDKTILELSTEKQVSSQDIITIERTTDTLVDTNKILTTKETTTEKLVNIHETTAAERTTDKPVNLHNKTTVEKTTDKPVSSCNITAVEKTTDKPVSSHKITTVEETTDRQFSSHNIATVEKTTHETVTTNDITTVEAIADISVDTYDKTTAERTTDKPLNTQGLTTAEKSIFKVVNTRDVTDAERTACKQDNIKGTSIAEGSDFKPVAVSGRALTERDRYKTVSMQDNSSEDRATYNPFTTQERNQRSTPITNQSPNRSEHPQKEPYTNHSSHKKQRRHHTRQNISTDKVLPQIDLTREKGTNKTVARKNMNSAALKYEASCQNERIQKDTSRVYQIFVKNKANWGTTVYSVQPSETISTIKQKICEKECVPVEVIVLRLFTGTELLDNFFISDYYIFDGHNLVCSYRHRSFQEV